MLVTAVDLLVNAKRKDLEAKLKSQKHVGDFDIEELDKKDGMKDVMVSFAEPVDLKYATTALNELQDLLKSISIAPVVEEE